MPKYQDDDIIEVPFEKFLVAVNRKVEGICGLGTDDLPDVDFGEFYPGESAKFIEYKEAVRDCANHVVRYAGGSMLLGEEIYG